MKFTFSYNKDDEVYVFDNGVLKVAFVDGVSALANEDGVYCTYYLIPKNDKDDTIKKKENEIFNTKLACVKAFLGVDGDFDEALI